MIYMEENRKYIEENREFIKEKNVKSVWKKMEIALKKITVCYEGKKQSEWKKLEGLWKREWDRRNETKQENAIV